MITDSHVFWMDNGRNRTDHTMLDSGEQSSPVRLWWARNDDGSIRSVEISGLPYGTESNPPGWDAERGTVVAYDAGNAVVRAWRMQGDDLEPLWRRDGLAHAGHLIVYPDTRELVVGDWRGSRFLMQPVVRRISRVLGPVLGARPAPPPAGRPLRRPATGWSSSTSIPAPRRQGWRFPRRPRDTCSRRRASGATSTTSR